MNEHQWNDQVEALMYTPFYLIPASAKEIISQPGAFLDKLVEIGLIVRFNTGKGGHGVAYGLPLGEHQHVWHMPEVVDRRNMSPANEFVYLTWYCELPGCKATMQTTAYLAEKDK